MPLQEPIRSLPLGSSTVRAVPCCLDFQPSQRSDSADLIVGVSDGTGTSERVRTIRACLSVFGDAPKGPCALHCCGTGQNALQTGHVAKNSAAMEWLLVSGT